MIEHMFDGALLDPRDRVSVLETGLRGWLETHRPRQLTTVERLAGPVFELAPTVRHGDGSLSREGHEDTEDRRLGEFRQLLETGARHLGAGGAARREQCRQVAL